MEEFVAYNSRWRVTALFLLGVGFVVLGVWMVGWFGDVPSSGSHSALWTKGAGWLCILFFGSCVAVYVKKFFDERAQLQIGPDGIVWSPWANQLIPWSEIADVTTWTHKGQRFIVLHLNHPDHFPGRGLAAKLAGVNRQLTGGDISISLTGTDRSFDDATSAIARFRG